MQTPAVLTFLHMLAAVLALWLADRFDVFKLELSLATLKGSSVRLVLYSTQVRACTCTCTSACMSACVASLV